MTDKPEPIPPPLLPSRVDPERLRDLEAAALDAEATRLAEAERATRTAMSPYDRQLREIRARMEEVATERRRRERAGRHAARIAVREMAGSGEMPALAGAGRAAPAGGRPPRGGAAASGPGAMPRASPCGRWPGVARCRPWPTPCWRSPHRFRRRDRSPRCERS